VTHPSLIADRRLRDSLGIADLAIGAFPDWGIASFAQNASANSGELSQGSIRQ
jgi:hypothetical protein